MLALAGPAAAHHLEASVSVPIRTLAAIGAKPDLYPLLPTISAAYEGTVPAVFIDAYELENRVVYRFDTVIANAGGTLDLYSANGGESVKQMLWSGGRPPANSRPKPTSPPEDQSAATKLSGRTMVYSNAVGHWHWHYDGAARYELLLAKGKKISGAKIGFCLFDTYDFTDKEAYFRGSGTQSEDWCRPNLPGTSFVRMGISPGVGDYYAAQLADQWIDVTGLKPANYVLRATANPGGHLIETDLTNNVLEEARAIPGAIARDLAQSVPSNTSADITFAGEVVAPEIHAFAGWAKNATGESCQLRFAECYVTADPNLLSFDITVPPEHGTLSLGSSNGTTAVATYVPDPGYAGPDSFSYTTTDTRQLTSRPATVVIGVGNTPVVIAAPIVKGTQALGANLTALAGTWLAPKSAALDFQFQWQRCGSKGANCSDISGRRSSTYRVVKADIGRRLRVLVTASSAIADATVSSRTGRRVSLFTTIQGTQFDDILFGKQLFEKIQAGRGSDVVRGRGGNDVIRGGPGNDRLFGGLGVDRLHGGAGNDHIGSRDGRIDIVTCGSGFDTVVADRKDRIARSCERVTRR